MNQPCMNQPYRLPIVLGIVFAVVVGFSARRCGAETRIRDMCRVKGMEINTLRGLGLVVGLNGSGEPGGQATIQALSQMLRSMGSPSPQTDKGQAIQAITAARRASAKGWSNSDGAERAAILLELAKALL